MYAISRFNAIEVAAKASTQASWLIQSLIREEGGIQTIFAESKTVLFELGRLVMQNCVSIEMCLELRCLPETTLL